MTEKRLIEANALRKRIEDWMREMKDQDNSFVEFDREATLDDVIDYIDTAPTVQSECTCQKWHPASEIPPLHHVVEKDETEGDLERDQSEPLLVYTENEGYKIGVYLKDDYGFSGWVLPDLCGNIFNPVEWKYLPKPTKGESA